MFADVDIEAIMGMGIGFFLVVVVPTIAILLHHQRKMAELVRRPVSNELEMRFVRMQQELDELRSRTAQQTLALDECKTLLASRPLPAPPRIEV